MSERILVLGANGMLGSEALMTLAPDFDVWGACRRPEMACYAGVPLVGGLDATDAASADDVLRRVKPTVVINAVGIVKQLEAAKDAVPSITVNSLWPHVLADACERHGARLVHVSTDCVFSGSCGMYTEDDIPDALDLYGRSKLLGEVTDREHVATLRTSIIGWQHGSTTGLLEWFAAHRHGQVRGFTRAVFSGLTTRALTEVIRDVVIPDESLSGLWHVSAEPIDKHTLLKMIAEHMEWAVDLVPSPDLVIDRSLDSTRLRDRTGWAPQSWREMVAAL